MRNNVVEGTTPDRRTDEDMGESVRTTTCLTLMCVACSVSSPATAAVDPYQLRELYDKLAAPQLDDQRSLAAAGRTLVAEDLEITLGEGALHPIVRSDGRITGLVFVGTEGGEPGTLVFTPPDLEEQRQLERFAGDAPYEATFDAAWLLATDDSLEQLVGDSSWSDGGGHPQRARNIHLARHEAYADPLWDDWGPSLEMDVLDDLFGDGFRGGYLFAEFRTAAGTWETCYHNPRGALFPTEEIAWFTHVRKGDGPPWHHVHASYPSVEHVAVADRAHPYDLISVSLDVTVPRGGGERNLDTLTLVAELEVEAKLDGMHGILLELQGRLRRTLGDDEWADLDVKAVHDEAGRSLPAIQDRNRLFVAIPEGLSTYERVRFRVTYEGAVIQPCTTDTYSPLMQFAWYPRAPWFDPHTFAATVHTPRELRAVCTGDMVDEQLVDGVRTVSFVENGPVAWGAMVVGEFLVIEGEYEGTPIRVFADVGNKPGTAEVIEHTQASLAWHGALWGEYPYDAVNIVDSSGLCALGPMEGLGTDYLYGPGKELRGVSGITFLPLRFGMPLVSLCGALGNQWWGNLTVPASYRDRWIVTGTAAVAAQLFLARFGIREEYVRLNRELDEVALYHDPPGAVSTSIRCERYFAQASARGHCVLRMLLAEIGGDPFIDVMQEVLWDSTRGGVTRDLLREASRPYLRGKTDAFFDYWVEGRQLPQIDCGYRIEREADGGWLLSGELVFDDVPPPNSIPLLITFAGGAQHSLGVIPTGPSTPFEVHDLPVKPRQVDVDPEHMILMRARSSHKRR
jgi:hypothetical protein